MVKLRLGVVALCLVLAACGTTGQRKRAPTKAAFAASANRICAEAASRKVRVTGLRALRPPQGGEDLYLHWLRAEEDALAAAEAVASPPDEAEGDPLVRLAIAEGKAAGYARRLGALVCFPS